MLAPKPQKRRKRSTDEWSLFLAYRLKIKEISGQDPMLLAAIAPLDLENDFYWLFRLSDLLANARRTFHSINEQHFSGALSEPKILFCARSSGGYYNKSRNEIGISLAMTIECGEPEFRETLLHEIAHMQVQSHSPKFYALLRKLGGSGRKAPVTVLLAAKRKVYLETRYPVIVRCPNCLREQRYRTRRALQYACRYCCVKYADGKFDAAYRFVEVKRLIATTT